jgi:NhaA family Na+:H+ antiporter
VSGRSLNGAPGVLAPDGSGARVPLAERLLAPFRRFAATEAAGGLVLLACTAVALAWANSPWAESYHHVWETRLAVTVGGRTVGATLHHLINDGLMAVFFFLVGLEIKREVLVGALASARRAALPVAAALGGMVVPAALYALVNTGGPGAAGWGVPMATDIAFALGVLALLGDRVPVTLKVFLAALAIADDIGAVLVIAAFYSGGVDWGALGLAGVLLLASAGANAAGVRRPWAYALLGLPLWGAVLASGVHATVAGVLLAFTIPVRTRVDESHFLAAARRALDDFDQALGPPAPGPNRLARAVLTNAASQEALHCLEELTEAAQPPLHRLEHGLHGVVAFGIMPLFALANAGVTLATDAPGGAGGGALASFGQALATPVAIGVALGLVIGKPLGITLGAWLAVRLGVAELPPGVGWRPVHGVSWLGGIGFTMALFVAGLAFRGPEGVPLLAEAKLGVLLASLAAGLVGWLLLRGPLAASAAAGAPAAARTPAEAV